MRSNRDLNVSIFNDSMYLMESNKKLKESIKNSIESQSVILETDNIDVDLDIYPTLSKIYVTKSSSFDAAREYDGNHIAVLNFASATNPGGGVTKGSSAQEECLCRSSTLYKALNIKDCFNKFYNPHRSSGNALHNDDIIYTKDVVIFKSDSYNLLDEADWVKADVITCAAPNLRENPKNQWNPDESEHIDISDDDLYKLHKKRANRILSVAALNKVDTIILGAFGCGAFKNKPEVVAKAYKDVLPAFRKAFKNIEFAVYCRPQDTTNYDVFKRIIHG